MKKVKRATSFYINEQQEFLFRLICKYYGINPSRKIDEMIQSFNKMYSHDFLNQSRIGQWVCAVCNKPWAISEVGGLEEGISAVPAYPTLEKVDLKKMLELKEEILRLQRKGDKIEKWRPEKNNTMTNLFEGSVKWEEK